MAMTIREAFDKGTETFNAHDIDGFTSVLADDGSCANFVIGVTQGEKLRVCGGGRSWRGRTSGA